MLPLKKVMGKGWCGTLLSSPATVLPERASFAALRSQRVGPQEAECCVFVLGQSPFCLSVGRNLAFVSWMAIKGTENICVTNALLYWVCVARFW